MPLELTIRTAPLPAAPAANLVLYAADGGSPEGAAADLWTATGLDWSAVIAAAGFKGKQGNVLDILMPAGIDARRLLVLGSGKPGSSDAATAWTDRGGSLAGKLLGLRITEAAVVVDGDEVTPERLAELVAGLRLRAYRFDRYKSPKTGDDNGEPQRLAITLHVADPAAADRAIADRAATVEGTLLARDLVNEPANELGTVEFADRAAQLSELGVEVEVLEEAQLRELGMRSLLAVSQGSARPPRLVVMRWNGGGKDAPTLAFVGKGVVFDTGGISIKPAASMEDMKGDMGGAAAVTGLLHTLARRQAKLNVVSVIGLVENMPSATATRPGDILRAMSGTTIEVVNTDAEGRLVL